MDTRITCLMAGISLSGNIAQDVATFLTHHDCPRTAGHSARVAAAARHLAQRFHGDPIAAEQAGWLHDISAVIPNRERIAYAEAWQIDVLPEERLVPMIIHQKLSAYMAAHIFQITDPATLSAVGCHTTLKPQPSQLDKLVFIADKWKWDGTGDPPYLADLEARLACSLDTATHWYLSYLWERRATLLVRELCQFYNCRIVKFMIHDRIAFGGALVAVGMLYIWLAESPLRQQQAWAWWAYLLFCVAGFLISRNRFTAPSSLRS